MRFRLLLASFFCGITLSTLLCADLGTSWNKAYTRAFKLLEQNPAVYEQEIIAIASELKDLAQKLRVADFITRSQDPLEALEIYHLLEKDPTPATVKEVERRIRWFAQQKRKKLVEYLTKILKQSTERKVATPKTTAIKTTVPVKAPLKPSIPSQPPIAPALQQPITSVLPEEEHTEPISEPVMPVIQKEIPKKGRITPSSTSTSAARISEQAVVRKRADQLIKMLKTVSERIARLTRTTALGRKRSLPQEDQEVLDDLAQKLKQSITADQLKGVESELLVITRMIELLETLERWPALSDERFDLFMDRVREQARSEGPISSVVNQLQQEIIEAIAQATESKKEDENRVMQESTGKVVSQVPQRSVQGLVNDLDAVIKELQKKQTNVQRLTRIHAGDVKLMRVAPTVISLLKAQEDFARYIVNNPDVITAVAQQPAIIKQSMLGQSGPQAEQALIQVGVKPTELQEMNALIQPIQTVSAQAIALVQEDPQGVLQTFTRYNLPFLSLVQTAVDKPSSVEIEVMAEPTEQVQAPVHIAPASTHVPPIEQLSLQVSHAELPSGVQELEWPTVEVAPSIPGHQIIGQQPSAESAVHEPVEYRETEAIPYTPRKRVQEPSLAEPSQRPVVVQPEVVRPAAPVAQAHVPEVSSVPVVHVPSVTHSKPSALPEPASPVVRDNEIEKLKTQIAVLKEKVEQLLQDAPHEAHEYQKYLQGIIASLEPTQLIGQDKKTLTELHDMQTKAYQHLVAHVEALKVALEWKLKDFDQVKAYDIVATKLTSIQGLSPTTDQYKKDFLPQAIMTLIDEIYYRPKREKIEGRIATLKAAIETAKKDFANDAAAETYATKLKSLADQLSYVDIQDKNANKALSRIQREYDNLKLLADVAKESPDWDLAQARAQVYKELVQKADQNQTPLSKEDAEKIVKPLLEEIRLNTIEQLVKSSLSAEQLKTINLDKAIKAGVSIKDLIDDNLIVQTIKQTVQLLQNTTQKRLTDEQLLEKTLQGQASLAQDINEILRDAINEKIIAANNEIDTLFASIADDGLRYYLFTLVKAAGSDDDQLEKQQKLIDEDINEAITSLTNYSEGRPGRVDDLDRIRGALIRDWGSYWNSYGGVRRVMTQKEIEAIIAQAQQAPLILKIQALLEQVEHIDQAQLNDREKRNLALAQQALAREDIDENELQTIEEIVEALISAHEEQEGSESEGEESEGDEEELEP